MSHRGGRRDRIEVGGAEHDGCWSMRGLGLDVWMVVRGRRPDPGVRGETGEICLAIPPYGRSFKGPWGGCEVGRSVKSLLPGPPTTLSG